MNFNLESRLRPYHSSAFIEHNQQQRMGGGVVVEDVNGQQVRDSEASREPMRLRGNSRRQAPQRASRLMDLVETMPEDANAPLTTYGSVMRRACQLCF